MFAPLVWGIASELGLGNIMESRVVSIVAPLYMEKSQTSSLKAETAAADGHVFTRVSYNWYA